MIIKGAKFITSQTNHRLCPEPLLPEYAFIGRSNVGKSSLINSLLSRKFLAKISGTPGKTKTINHFLINHQWYLVDLPGYGFAKASKQSRNEMERANKNYLIQRPNLVQVFVLIDSRLLPQKLDLEWVRFMGDKQIPLSIVFTKADKIKSVARVKNQIAFKNELLNHWEELPLIFTTSSINHLGRDSILSEIEKQNHATEGHFINRKNPLS